MSKCGPATVNRPKPPKNDALPPQKNDLDLTLFVQDHSVRARLFKLTRKGCQTTFWPATDIATDIAKFQITSQRTKKSQKDFGKFGIEMY